MRGRTIYGGLVPWGQVWRTGANEATHLRTPADLQVGEALIPAGEYTLYTIPAEGGWTLIVNRQTGQWGTVYDQSQDLVRIPMPSSSLAAPVEMFTITIGPGGETDGIVHLDWERTRVSFAFDIAG